jgi:cold-inducible RNA-binding protein
VLYSVDEMSYTACGWFVERARRARWLHVARNLSHTRPPTFIQAGISASPMLRSAEGTTRDRVAYRKQETVMGRKLYVGNLDPQVDNSVLQQLLAAYGTVSNAQVVMDRDTGRSRGFGFVEMGSETEAQAAVAALNGRDYAGRALVVSEAKPRDTHPRQRGSKTAAVPDEADSKH